MVVSQASLAVIRIHSLNGCNLYNHKAYNRASLLLCVDRYNDHIDTDLLLNVVVGGDLTFML